MRRKGLIRTRLGRVAPAAFLAVAGFCATGAIPLPPGPLEAQEPIELRREFPPDGYLKIYGGAGSVEVVGWERDSLVVTGNRRPGPGRFFQIVEDGVAKLGFEVAAERADAVDADLRVRIPASATVWIKVVSAGVTVHGLAGGLDVLSVSGRVEVAGSPRTVYVESMAGDVSLELEQAGVVRTKVGGGVVEVRGEIDHLAVSSVDGSIHVDRAAAHRAELKSIGGRVAYRGGLARGGWLSVDTHEGDVELILPPGLGAAFDLSTVEGAVESELGARPTSRRGFPGTRIVFETGTGEAGVEARSFSGTIRVRADPELRREAR